MKGVLPGVRSLDVPAPAHLDRGLLALVRQARDFGSDLSAGDTDGDGYPDLAVGVSYENFGSLVRLRDIDRDGDKDLLVSSNYYDPSVLLPGTGSVITVTGTQEPR